MRAITIKTDSGDINLFVPISWQEVTVEQYTRLESEGWDGLDLIHLLSMLSGHKLRELDNLKDTSILDVLTQHIGFIATNPPDFNKLRINKRFTLGGKKIEVPADLELESLGQKILMSNIMQQDNMIKQIPNALAIYFQPIYDGSDFDRKRLPHIVKMINQTPIVLAYPVVAFFFRKLIEYKRSGLTF